MVFELNFSFGFEKICVAKSVALAVIVNCAEKIACHLVLGASIAHHVVAAG